jgi:predicted nucleic acid-binding protein
MRSIDTNILFHGFNEDSPPATRRPMRGSCQSPAWRKVAISEFILVEFHGLLRNPAALEHPLSADEAVDVIETYRTHPRWRLIGFPIESRPLHDALWERARATDFAFRKLHDVRSALTMISQGVTDFATANLKDFEGLGFRRVWNPIAE